MYSPGTYEANITVIDQTAAACNCECKSRTMVIPIRNCNSKWNLFNDNLIVIMFYIPSFYYCNSCSESDSDKKETSKYVCHNDVLGEMRCLRTRAGLMFLVFNLSMEVIGMANPKSVQMMVQQHCIRLFTNVALFCHSVKIILHN